MSTPTKNTAQELAREKAALIQDQKNTSDKAKTLETKNTNELSRSEIEALVEKAHLLNNPILMKALYIESYRRGQTTKELNTLGKKIRSLIKRLSQETDPEKFQKILFENVLKQNKLDLQLVQALNTHLKDKPKSFPVATHKLTYPVTSEKEGIKTTTEWGSIEGARKFLEQHFTDICDNKPLGDYVYDAEHNNADIVTVLGNTAGAKGNPRETDLKAGFITVLSELYKLNSNSKDPISPGHDLPQGLSQGLPQGLSTGLSHDLPHASNINFDVSSLADLRELPELDPSKIGFKDEQGNFIPFNQCTYFYQDERSKAALVVPQSGYEFGGGHIPEKRQAQGKLLGSRDCSSFISEITGCAKPVSTLSQLFYYNLKTQGLALPYPEGPEPSTEPEKKAWQEKQSAADSAQKWAMEKLSDETSSEVEILSNHFDVVKDPSKAKPGDVLFYRTYNPDLDPKKLGKGTGGHTADLAEEIRPNGDAWTLGANRERAKKPVTFSYIEGIGMQCFSIKDEPGKKVMILTPKVPR